MSRPDVDEPVADIELEYHEVVGFEDGQTEPSWG